MASFGEGDALVCGSRVVFEKESSCKPTTRRLPLEGSLMLFLGVTTVFFFIDILTSSSLDILSSSSFISLPSSSLEASPHLKHPLVPFVLKLPIVPLGNQLLPPHERQWVQSFGLPYALSDPLFLFLFLLLFLKLVLQTLLPLHLQCKSPPKSPYLIV